MTRPNSASGLAESSLLPAVSLQLADFSEYDNTLIWVVGSVLRCLRAPRLVFFQLSLSQPDPRSAAVLVDELDRRPPLGPFLEQQPSTNALP